MCNSTELNKLGYLHLNVKFRKNRKNGVNVSIMNAVGALQV